MKRKADSQLQKQSSPANPAAETEPESDAFLDAKVTLLMQHQHQIDKLAEQSKWEKYQIEYQYNKKMHNLFNERKNFIDEIPEFWLRVFMNHEVLSGCIGSGEVDVPILIALKDIKVQIFPAKPADDAELGGEDEQEQQETQQELVNGFQVELVFDDNEWIENKTLWKRFFYSPYDVDQLIAVEQSGVTWKRDARSEAADSEEPFESFFEFFEGRKEHEEEVFILLRDEAYMDPMKYYLQPIDLGAEEEGEGEDEGEE